MSASASPMHTDGKIEHFDGIESGPPSTSGPESPSKVKPLAKRINTFQKFMNGDGMTAEDTDLIMNTIALINALVLTIPYSLSGSLDNSYWDWVQTTLNSTRCTDYVEKYCPSGPSACFQQSYSQVQNSLYCTVYASITALGISFAYYLMRPKFIDDNDENKRKVVYVHYIYTNKPEDLEKSDRKILQTIHQDSGNPNDKKEKDDSFLKWWMQGKYVILIVVVSTFISVVTVLVLYGIVARDYVTSTSRYCVDSPRNHVAISVANVIFCSALLVSMYFMY
jgi:hypothetical protein